MCKKKKAAGNHINCPKGRGRRCNKYPTVASKIPQSEPTVTTVKNKAMRKYMEAFVEVLLLVDKKQ